MIAQLLVGFGAYVLGFALVVAVAHRRLRGVTQSQRRLDEQLAFIVGMMWPIALPVFGAIAAFVALSDGIDQAIREALGEGSDR